MISSRDWSQKKLGYKFGNDELLDLALTHKSFSSRNNERLEFLGDSVLGFVIAEALYRQESEVAEGGLTRLRASLVRGETLALIALDIDLSTVMHLGAGEKRSGSHQRQSILADGLEAVLGAILIDGGFEATKAVILRLFEPRLASLPALEALKDSKTLLQEALQARALPTPVYEVVQEEGPPHARKFDVSCCIAACSIYTSGDGSSRRAAEQEAAAKALLMLADE
ncbi:MAG: ribonuclease III [Gammaproteobacteria bacterium]|nr:ribonuclease III [Gammaproteobacteria bacterium]MCP4088791.1 ribonuclease III [Gammaproteobacteria bacterium]MCP4275910.1 ribonuclease III [Gammaproteobacteria bacterium]MCP4832126.1 ribonuclease III [Gammaproteobacteria bacterium]MCP4928273.1 ribonuclease III [Gammaproteobacteria bacterium]